MNYLQLFSKESNPRIRRLVADGAAILSNRLDREPTEIEILNLRRKARIVALNEQRIFNAAKGEQTGIFTPLPEVNLANDRFQMPADNLYMIASIGDHPHPKGLVQVIDNESVHAMQNTFNTEKAANPNFVGLLVDPDHISQSGSTSALGWIENVVANPPGKEPGLWGNIKWTDEGRTAVENGRYRFISPVWKRSDCADCDDKQSNRCRPMRLDSAALTNQPNLSDLVPVTR